MRGTLVIFLKAPVLGRVKTRLAAGIGQARATGFYRQATDSLIRRLSGDARWRTVLAVDPPVSALKGWDHLWPPHLPRIAQGSDDLGARLRRVTDAMPPGPVVIIGSDAPQVSRGDIAAAFRVLGAHDAVAGPAVDGGYWLIGLRRKRPAPNAFRDVRWSGPHALADTLASLPERFSVTRLQTLRDIDEANDLAAEPHAVLRSVTRRD